MHQVFCFLVDVEDDVSLDSAFEEFDLENLGENNYSCKLCAVTEDGDLYKLCPEDDWRERYEFQDKFAGYPKEERWKFAMEFAVDAAETELRLSISPFYMYDVDAISGINIDNYRDALHKALKEGRLERWAAIHTAASMARQLECMETKPFTSLIVNPYESIGAIDLSSPDTKKAILFVDVHM